MDYFPMFLRMTGRRVVIVGGGEAAAQKARLMLKTGAELDLVARNLSPELSDLAKTGGARHIKEPPRPETFADAALVFIAAGSGTENRRLHALAKKAGSLVNVVDEPKLCDAITPALVDRDPVVVAIGTEGTAPVLARQIKTRIETILDPEIGKFATFAGRLRDRVAAAIAPEGRRAFWAWFFDKAPWQEFRGGRPLSAARVIETALRAGRAPTHSGAGQVARVIVEPDAPDLLTVRAVRQLQDADVICFHAGLDAGVLEFARRDAERVVLARDPRNPQRLAKDDNLRLRKEALRGRRVIYLMERAGISETTYDLPAPILRTAHSS